MIGEKDERGLQHRWADGAFHRIESRIDEIALEAGEHARVIKVRRERIKQRLIERREAERQRQQEMERERLRERVTTLRNRIDLFDRIEKVATLLQTLRAAYAGDQSISEFLAWADRQIACIRELQNELTDDDI